MEIYSPAVKLVSILPSWIGVPPNLITCCRYLNYGDSTAKVEIVRTMLYEEIKFSSKNMPTVTSLKCSS